MTLNSVEGRQVSLSFATSLSRPNQTPYLPTLVAHKIYGVPQTINSANYVYFLAMNELFQLEPGSSPTAVSTVVVNVEGPQKSITPIALCSNSSQARFPDLRPVDRP